MNATIGFPKKPQLPFWNSVAAIMSVFTGKIEQSPNDKRQYRHLTLANQLQVILVSDPETEKSAACCDVNVGSLSDPREALGLAHFLEHMLFMGTEKYPQENAYSAYLSNHGGSSNAYTDDENTVYYFDVLNSHFEGALDLFASFFTCPLFSESGVMREINAVDSENSKNLQSDTWRKFQLFKNLAREDHPLHSFSTGNLQTLHEVPQSKGMNIRQLMIDFYHQYYSANLMKVSIYGKESLDVLQQWAIEKFSAVPNKNRPINHFPVDPFRPQEMKKIVEVVPVRDIKNLEMYFPLPAVEHLYRSKPAGYLSHLIGHESEGSILAALKKKSLANGLSSYLFQSSRDFACFGITIDLSEEGVRQVDTIIRCVFAYISMLRQQGPQEWVLQELMETSTMKFNFLDKKEPADYVIRLANVMHYYEPEHILSGNYLYYEKDLTKTKELMEYLIPENAIFMITHKGFEGQTALVEQWYSTKYNLKEFTSEQLLLWRRDVDGLTTDLEWRELLALPKPNPFIPTDFTLYTSTEKHSYPGLAGKEGKATITVPESPATETTTTATAMEVVEEEGESAKKGSATSESEEGEDSEEGYEEDDESEGSSPLPGTGVHAITTGDRTDQLIREHLLGSSHVVWSKLDDHWKVPKLNVLVSLENQFATLGPWNIAMTELLLLILKEVLNEYSYYADCSGLYYYSRLNRCGLDLIFRGYHHKLPLLIERVCLELKQLAATSTDKDELLFQRMKEKLLRNYKNTLFAQPYSHCILGSVLCLEEPRFSNQEKYLALQQITTVGEFRTFVKVFLSQLKVEVLLNGNYNPETMSQELLQDKIFTILGADRLPFSQQLSRRGVDLIQYHDNTGIKEFIYRQSAHSYNPNEINSAVENVYLVGVLATAGSGSNTTAGPVTTSRPQAGEVHRFDQDLILREALVQLFEQLMSEEAFDQLRTKEQLGYIVFTGMKRVAQNLASLHIIVQSHHKDPIYLDHRIETFLQYYYDQVLVPMTTEKFQHFVTAVKEKLLEKPKNLDEESDRYWEEISYQTYLFQRHELMVERLDDQTLVTKDVAKAFFEKYFLAASQSRVKLSSQFFGAKTTFPATDKSNKEVMVIEDPNLFKRQLPLLPVLSASQF